MRIRTRPVGVPVRTGVAPPVGRLGAVDRDDLVGVDRRGGWLRWLVALRRHATSMRGGGYIVRILGRGESETGVSEPIRPVSPGRQTHLGRLRRTREKAKVDYTDKGHRRYRSIDSISSFVRLVPPTVVPLCAIADLISATFGIGREP